MSNQEELVNELKASVDQDLKKRQKSIEDGEALDKNHSPAHGCRRNWYFTWNRQACKRHHAWPGNRGNNICFLYDFWGQPGLLHRLNQI